MTRTESEILGMRDGRLAAFLTTGYARTRDL
jgi:hypothetical protein